MWDSSFPEVFEPPLDLKLNALDFQPPQLYLLISWPCFDNISNKSLNRLRQHLKICLTKRITLKKSKFGKYYSSYWEKKLYNSGHHPCKRTETSTQRSYFNCLRGKHNYNRADNFFRFFSPNQFFEKKTAFEKNKNTDIVSRHANSYECIF